MATNVDLLFLKIQFINHGRVCFMGTALNCNIGFIGGGNMAQALIGGLISRGLPATRITVSDPVDVIRE